MTGPVHMIGGYATTVVRYRRVGWARRHKVGWWVAGVALAFVLGLVIP